MVKLLMGYLFKKSYIIYQGKKQEIFEFIDYVTAMCFNSTSNNVICNVVSGNSTGIYASFLNKDFNELEHVFSGDDINKVIEENEKTVNFVEIRKKKISSIANYYLRNDSGTH